MDTPSQMPPVWNVADYPPIQRAGFYARNVRGLRLREVEVTEQLGLSLALNDVSKVEISGRLARERPLGR